MSREDSTSAVPAVKPEPPPGLPLVWHQSGVWCKKNRSNLHYFGRGFRDEAIAESSRQATDLHAGRRPRDLDSGSLTVSAGLHKFVAVQ